MNPEVFIGRIEDVDMLRYYPELSTATNHIITHGNPQRARQCNRTECTGRQ